MRLFLSVIGALIASSAALTASFLNYKRASRVEVREDGLLLGGKRLIKWEDVDDMRFSTETYVDLEVEGGPVMGYGMRGYAPSGSVTRHVYKYVDAQLFHRDGVDEMRFTPKEFWRFIKAVLRTIEDQHELIASRSWPQKLKKLDKAF